MQNWLNGTQIARRLKQMIKPPLGLLFGGRAATNADCHPLCRNQSLRQKLLRHVVFERLERDGDFEKLQDSHSRFWSSEQSDYWYDESDRRFQQFTLVACRAYLRAMRDLCDAGELPLRTWCEVGTGAGQLLNYLAQQFPQVEQFVGLDVNGAQIERNRDSYSNPKLAFHHLSVEDWIAQHARPGTVYLTNYGVFEYLAEPTLTEILANIGERLRPAALALVEPVADDHNLKTDPSSRPYGYERSFSHNYPRLLQSAGFIVRYCEEEIINDQRFIKILAT